MQPPRSQAAARVIGTAALAAAAPIAWLASRLESAFPNPERRVAAMALAFLLLLAAPTLAYVAGRRRAADPRGAALLVLVTAAVLLCGIWLYCTLPAILFPADILIWSESDFVNDIIKFRVGYPLYTDQKNNESFTYPPGTQILTYAAAYALGKPTSVPTYRAVQLVFVLAAVAIAAACCGRLLRLSRFGAGDGTPGLWSALNIPILFLAATNPLTNPFTHNLHNDALALLVSAAAYYVLLGYTESRKRRFLAGMILLPGLGFAVKQSLLVWLPLSLLHLVVFDRPRSWRRVIAVLGLGSGFAAAVIGSGYLLWGDAFRYWVLTVLGAHGVSPLRSFRHLITVWPYVLAGLFGAWVLLRGEAARRLAGPWTVWLLLTLTQISSSGIAWMMNHIGPGSLLAMVWFLAGLRRVWPGWLRGSVAHRPAVSWFRAGLVATALLLMYAGWGFLRVPLPAVPKESYEYVARIERQFQDTSPERVLLDVGSWVYLRVGVVMRDRAPCIGERGYSQTGDFAGVLGRLERRQYSKILVRRLHSPDFWYDHFLWPKSSGIRKKLLDNYREVERIPAGWEVRPMEVPPYLFDEVSVLIPKP